MRRLMVTTGSETAAHELVEAAITLGRSPENMIVLDDPSVSSRHAQLQLIGDEYQLQDLDSTNGTRVNERAITTTILHAGDRIRFGKVEARFESERTTQAQPLPLLTEMAAPLAQTSARPADFTNASPFPNRQARRDPMRAVIFAAAAIALLAFVASMIALLQMQPPAP